MRDESNLQAIYDLLLRSKYPLSVIIFGPQQSSTRLNARSSPGLLALPCRLDLYFPRRGPITTHSKSWADPTLLYRMEISLLLGRSG